MDELIKLREDIDKVDEKMVELFEKRMELVLGVAEYKKQNNIGILNKSREEEVIAKCTAHLKNKKIESDTSELIKFIMKLSKDYESRVMTEKNS